MRGYLFLPGLIAISLTSLALPSLSEAHPGGLNAEGCHNNRKTGDYHCHGGNRSSASSASKRRSLLSGSAGGAFRNCTAARAAGAAPVHAGDPGYGPHLDRDGDGIGCE